MFRIILLHERLDTYTYTTSQRTYYPSDKFMQVVCCARKVKQANRMMMITRTSMCRVSDPSENPHLPHRMCSASPGKYYFDI